MNSTLASSLPKQYVLPPICPLMEQSVCMSLPSASPIVHMFLYSPVTARAAVAMPIRKAPARADLMYGLMIISSSGGSAEILFSIQLYAQLVPPSVTEVTYL